MTVPAFVVHDLEQAKAALKVARELRRRVLLVSAPNAAATLGPAVWREIIAEADKAHPGALAGALLDCGDEPGHALAALRAGLKSIRTGATPEVRAKIADMAAQMGATIVAERPDPACEMGGGEAFSRARDWLSRV